MNKIEAKKIINSINKDKKDYQDVIDLLSVSSITPQQLNDFFSTASKYTLFENKAKLIALIKTPQLFEALDAVKKIASSHQKFPQLFKGVITQIKNDPDNVNRLLEGCKTLNNSSVALEINEDLLKEIFSHLENFDKITLIFQKLHEAEISIKDNKKYYTAAAGKYQCLSALLLKNIITLENIGANFKDYPTLYQNLFDSLASYNHQEFFEAMIVNLKKLKEAIKNDAELYALALSRSRFVDELLIGIESLKSIGATLLNDKEMYIELFNNPHFAHEKLFQFEILKKSGINYPDEREAYIHVLKYRKNYNTLEDNLTALRNVGAIFAKNKDLYLTVITTHGDSIKLKSIFHILKKLGATFEQNKNLFLAVIERASSADNLNNYFKSLTQAGIPFQGNEELYIHVISNCIPYRSLDLNLKALQAIGATYKKNKNLFEMTITSAAILDDTLSERFALAHMIGATLKDDEDLYLKAIPTHNIFPAEIRRIFQALQKAGATLKDDKELYLNAFTSESQSEHLFQRIAALESIGATPQKDKELYLAVINNKYTARDFYISIDDALACAFRVLSQAGAHLQINKNLYLACITQNDIAQLPSALSAIHDTIGLSIKDHPELFLNVINNLEHYTDFSLTIKAMMKMGACFQNHKNLYLQLVQNFAHSQEIQKTISLLTSAKLNLTNDITYYESALKNPILANYILTELSKLNINKESHPLLYQFFFVQDNQPRMPSHSLTMKLIQALCDYHAKTPLLKPTESGFIAQSYRLRNHLNAIIADDSQLFEGPLNKSKATHELQRILAKLSLIDITTVTMHFDNSHGYILTFNDEPPIYLNHLLNHVDFNHLALTKRLINHLGKKIESITTSFKLNSHDDFDETTKRLPIMAQKALASYTGDRCYKNMNRLFRGVAQIEDQKYTWISPVTGKENLLVNFMAGCLVNWAAKELPLKYLEAHHGNIPNGNGNILIRAEKLNGNEDLAVYERRLANPVSTPSVTSVSIKKDGSPYFQSFDSTYTIFTTFNQSRPVINPHEGEQLIPHGTTLIYTKNKDGGFLAQEVNSPNIRVRGDYWSDTALSEAHIEHLKNRYKDTASTVTVNGIEVERPNHGMPHTLRVKTLIDVVIDYFAQHSQDEEFRLFCIYIKDTERQWLRAAAAFSITGRESEISAHEDLTRYDQFRQASQEHFSAFLKTHPPKMTDAAMQERMEHIVRFMGNPAYENATETNAAINQHPDPMEQKHRNFIHRILTIAHKMDLPRCYAPGEVNRVMTACSNLSASSASQQLDFKNLILYSINLIKAHGNTLETDIKPDSTLISASQSYQPPFERVSHSIRDAQAMIDSVAPPIFAAMPLTENPEITQKILEMCGYTKQPASVAAPSNTGMFAEKSSSSFNQKPPENHTPAENKKR